MLLNEIVMAKRGPLSKIWMSAYHERKVSKQQALGIDVGESVGEYQGPSAAPTMAKQRRARPRPTNHNKN
jgi:cohesin complex subunit SCC1